MTEHYDVIIVGSGAGGGTLAHTLAPSGKRILLLERGDFLARETDNWDPAPVFVDGKYISPDTWYDADGKPFQPQVHYFVGGATKMYGAALYRLRPEDFGELKHADGVSPAWPLTYDDFELRKLLNHVGMAAHHVLGKNFYMSMDVPVAGVAHQAGTCRFGTDPATSVLDVNCKAHELGNLYVVDTSFFPSIGAVNPALTAMANAIRVGEHLIGRMS